MDWAVTTESISEAATRLSCLSNGTPLTWRQLIDAWRSAEFADTFSDKISAHPSTALRWESPRLVESNLDDPCEFVLVDSPSIDRPPNSAPFEQQIRDNPQTATFTNLGGDATLIVPGNIEPEANYTHLTSFLRTAGRQQQRALWAAVADALESRLSTKPVWLSTAGGGVAWLHVRLDDTPKYYSHHPYR